MAPTRVRSAKEKETNRLTQQRKRDAKREAKMEREELKKRGIVDKAAEEAELEEKAANALRQRKLRAKQVVSKSKRVSPCAVDVLGYVFRSALRLAGLVWLAMLFLLRFFFSPLVESRIDFAIAPRKRYS